jgi:hypothetical protein
VLGAGLLFGCQPKAELVRRKPEWALRTHFQAGTARTVFDDNLEVSVSISNTSASPVVVEHMERDARVLLKGTDGSSSTLHPFSVGVAKPIKLVPSEETTVSLLFRPLKSQAKTLSVYDEESALGEAPEGHQP